MTALEEININKLKDKMQLEFDFEIIPVKLELYSREKQCYSNVEEKVKRDGGKTHFGWSIHFTKKIIIEAERHSVWENDDEELVCITQNPNNYDEVIFLSDNKFVDSKEQIDNIRMNITNNPLVDDWICLSNTLGHIYYKFTNRKNDEAIIIEKPVLEVINKIEEFRSLVMGLIAMGRGERSICYCEKGVYHKRKYLQCHSKLFKKDINEMLQNITNFAKR